MALTPEEQAELNQLEGAAKPSALSPDEKAELDHLEGLSSGNVQAQPDKPTKVYEKPIGPEQASAVDRFSEKIQDPARWQAILNNTGPQSNPNLVQGDVPLVMPVTQAPAALQAASKFMSATPAARIAGGGLQGAAQGAYGAEPGHRMMGALKGAGIGAGMTAGLEGLSSALTPASEAIGEKAAEKAVGALGGNKAAFKKLGPAGVQELGQGALETGIVSPLTTPKSAANKTDIALDIVGNKIGSLIKGADAAGAPKIDGAKLGIRLLEDPEILSAKNTPGAEAMYDAAAKQAETLARNGEMTLEDAHNLRRRMDKAIRFNNRRMDLPPGQQEVLYKIRDSINGALNDAIEASGAGGHNELKETNRAYSQLSKMSDMAENRMAMNAGNRSIGLTDTIAGAAGLAKGGPAMAVPLALANKAGRTFGKGLQATGLNAASQALGGAGAMTKQSPAAMSAMVQEYLRKKKEAEGGI